MLMFQPLQRYADFQGRARRSEYWLFTLFIFIAAFVASIIDTVVFGGEAPVLVGILALGLIIPSLAVTVRRLHDTDRSGWWYLIAFLPLIGGLIIFIFSVLDGTPGPNKFGPDPKGRGVTVDHGEVFS